MSENPEKPDLEAQKLRADERWWQDWWGEDYSWDGLAKHTWQGWSVTPDDQLVETADAPDGSRPANLQDYWRWDGAGFRSDKALGDLLPEAERGQKRFHLVHLPERWPDGKNSWKTKPHHAQWALIEEELTLRMALARKTETDDDGHITGADRRAQLAGAQIRTLPRPPVPKTADNDGRAQMHLNAPRTRWLSDADFSNLDFASPANFDSAQFSGGDANFWDAQFSGGNAYFWDAQFSGGNAYFRGAQFSGGDANFTGAQFSGGDANFWDAQFSGGNANFRGAQFSGGVASFQDAQFSGGGALFWDAQFSGGNAYFNNAQFSGGDATFWDAQFSGGNANFNNAQFSGGNANFTGAQFSGGDANFWDAQFSGGDANFTGAQFSGGVASFQDAQFSGGNAYFNNAQFSGGNASFTGAQFGLPRRMLAGDIGVSRPWLAFSLRLETSRGGNKRANFDNAAFKKAALFLSAQFDAETTFRAARFEGPSEFGVADQDTEKLSEVRPGASFLQRLSFRGARFEALADFSRVGFPARAEDRNSVFEGARFFEPLDLKGIDRIPFSAFHGIRLDQGLLLDSHHPISGQFDAALVDAEDAAARDDASPAPDAERCGADARFAALEAGCRVLKTQMAADEDKAREQKFFRMELRARDKRPSTPWPVKFLSGLYGAVSDHGGAVWKPLGVSFGLMLVFWVLFAITGFAATGDTDLPGLSFWPGNPIHPIIAEASELARKNMVGPLHFFFSQDQVFGAHLDEGPHFWLNVSLWLLSAAQAILSLILLFLSGLALRRNFQIN